MSESDSKPAWLEAHENGCTLKEFCKALTDDEKNELISYLRECSRWGDIKSLMNDPIHGEEATLQFNHQQRWTAHEAQRQQQIAALPEIFQEITMEFRKIWWIADVHYPYKSEHVPESNMCLTGDGMGLCYFKVDSENNIELIVCHDEDLFGVLARNGIIEGEKTDAQKFLTAIKTYVILINGKFERFHGKQAVGHLNHD